MNNIVFKKVATIPFWKLWVVKLFGTRRVFHYEWSVVVYIFRGKWYITELYKDEPIQ